MSRRTQFRLLVALTIVWAVWAGWSLLGRATPYEVRVLDDLGQPIAGAVVDIEGDQMGTSVEDGRIPMNWSPSQTVLEVSAPGHVSQMLTVAERPEDVVDVVLKARIMRGRIVDSNGMAVKGAVITAGANQAVTDEEGHFHVRGAEPGLVTAERPAWLDTQFTWDGGAGEKVVEMQPFTARAVHISGDAAAERITEFVDMAMTTELNALMLDLKDEEGIVWYQTNNPLARAVGANWDAYDLEATVRRAHDEGLYVIGRVVLFNDPIAAVGKPDLAVWDTANNGPFNVNGQYFLDPTDPEARKYGLDLAIEACEMGVDEIQFDYVRFTDKPSNSIRYDAGSVDEAVRQATVSGFLQEAVALLRPKGCAVAADIFGYLTTAEGEGGIGQNWEDIAAVVDVVSPMVYPSHYSDGFYFDKPNDNPAGMVDFALRDGLERLTTNTIVRPWLQDFGYDETQVRAQITSAEKYGLGWMLWNSKSNVTVEALRGPR